MIQSNAENLESQTACRNVRGLRIGIHIATSFQSGHVYFASLRDLGGFLADAPSRSKKTHLYAIEGLAPEVAH